MRQEGLELYCLRVEPITLSCMVWQEGFCPEGRYSHVVIEIAVLMCMICTDFYQNCRLKYFVK